MDELKVQRERETLPKKKKIESKTGKISGINLWSPHMCTYPN